MADSTHLKLPFILPGQAQKHITHNEAIAALDTLAQLAVLDRHLGAPPTLPAIGARYIVAASPTGAWAGKADNVVAWDGAAWHFHAPEPGWLAFVLDENGLLAWSGAAWLPTVGLDSQVPLIGINVAADSTNRLAVSSDAVLFTHASESVHLALNKHSSADTASLIFETGFSASAEIGTAGDDGFHLKVSADGSTWIEALVVEQASGHVGIGVTTPAVTLDLGGPVRLMAYPVAGLPDAAVAAGQLVYVSDEAGGATPAFSDGIGWRRVADRAIVS
jgi:hypothetical protein